MRLRTNAEAGTTMTTAHDRTDQHHALAALRAGNPIISIAAGIIVGIWIVLGLAAAVVVWR